MIAARYNYQDVVSARRDSVEVDCKNELERIFYPRGIFVENVLLSEIGKVGEGKSKGEKAEKTEEKPQE